jgi:hypothetical protein
MEKGHEALRLPGRLSGPLHTVLIEQFPFLILPLRIGESVVASILLGRGVGWRLDVRGPHKVYVLL